MQPVSPRYHHLADNFVWLVRNTLNDCEGRSQAHAALAYHFMHDEVIPRLQAIYRLSRDAAEAEADELLATKESGSALSR